MEGWYVETDTLIQNLTLLLGRGGTDGRTMKYSCNWVLHIPGTSSQAGGQLAEFSTSATRGVGATRGGHGPGHT